MIKNAAVAAEFASADAQEVASAPRPAALHWTLRSLCALLFCVTGISLCRETVRRALHKLGFSFKKAHKLLGKASAGHRAEFVRELADWVRAAQQPDGPLLAFVDEAHLHLDADPGHSWAPRGQRLYVNSKSPALAQKRTCFGVYLYGAADPVQIHSTGWANSETTCDMLIALRAAYPQRPVVMVWDNVRYHHIKRCASKPSSWASAWYTCRPTVPT